MKKKDIVKQIIISLSIILFLLLSGISFAYFAVQLGKGANSSITAQTDSVDSLMFNNSNNALDIHAGLDNFTNNEEGHSLKSVSEVTATLIPNNTNNYAQKSYNVFLIIEANDYTYTTAEQKPELLIKLKKKIGTEEYSEYQEITTLSYKTVEDRMKVKQSGYDITDKNNIVYKLVSDYPIVADNSVAVHTWQIEITLVNLSSSQNENAGKSFKGSIYITTADSMELTQINTLKTEIQDNKVKITPILSAGTSKIVTYKYAFEETKETKETMEETKTALALEKNYINVYENTHEFTEEEIVFKPKQKYKIYVYGLDERGLMTNIYETIIET